MQEEIYKYYQDAEGEVYAFLKDGSQDAYIQPGLIPITKEAADALRFPPPTPEQQAQTIRAERDARLKETDLIIIRCAEAGEPVPAEWKAYRQALRDMPEQAGFPDTVVWPEKPGNGIKQEAHSGQAAAAEDITETEENTAGQQPA